MIEAYHRETYEAYLGDGMTVTMESRRGYLALLQDYLIPRAAWIHEHYTTLPEGLPQRVRDLAWDVTAGATNNYERARALETFLSTEFTYTLTPGHPPPGQDFVDHFLFDLQVGYCTYFATAFVVMARSLGIPARYVEGFLVRGAPNADGMIPVRNSMGHAWVEVYFEGYGWHMFEPTPPLSEPDQPVWGPGITPPGPPSPPLPPSPPVGDVLPPSPTPTPTPGVGPGQEPTTDDPEAGNLWPLIALVLLVPMALGLRVLTVHLRQGRIRYMAHGEAVLCYFERSLRIMKRSGAEIAETETAEQFFARVAGPPEVAAVFAKARYSPHEISREERRAVESAVWVQEEKLRTEIGRVRYWWCRYVMGWL